MAVVAGRVIFDRDRSATVNSGDSGIANIPVVLQNVDTNERLTVLTDVKWKLFFYPMVTPREISRVVESYGTQGGIPSPGDFADAETGSIPQGVNPPISTVTNPPVGSTNLDSVTPDTLFVTVDMADVMNQNFLNGPVIYTPIGALVDLCAVVSGGKSH